MKTYRVIAALLAIVMLLGVFAGCSKNSQETTDPANPGSTTGTKTETNDEKAASTSKYAYQAEYLPIPDNVQYVNTSTISGSNLYFTGSIIDGKKTYTDENGEEIEYDNYRSALFKMDVETGDCTELTEFQLPEVPEGWMGSTDLNTIQAGADGTLWAIYNNYTYRYNPPEDMAADDSMYNYYEEGENKTGLLHLDADGKEIKRIEFNQTDENGNSFYVSSFFVDNSGNVYLSDWQNVYIYDQDGNKKTTVDLGENGGDLHHGASHGGRSVELLTDGDEVNVPATQILDELGKVADVAAASSRRSTLPPASLRATPSSCPTPPTGSSLATMCTISTTTTTATSTAINSTPTRRIR